MAPRYRLFDALDIHVPSLAGRVMDDKIGVGELVYDIRIALAEDPLEEATDDGFVLFGRHRILSPFF